MKRKLPQQIQTNIPQQINAKVNHCTAAFCLLFISIPLVWLQQPVLPGCSYLWCALVSWAMLCCVVYWNWWGGNWNERGVGSLLTVQELRRCSCLPLPTNTKQSACAGWHAEVGVKEIKSDDEWEHEHTEEWRNEMHEFTRPERFMERLHKLLH